jgi:mannosyltransferase OCH1-like enzyme
MIPKLIHQIWFGPKSPPERYMQTWERKNPGWTYKLWREGDPAIFPLQNQARFDWIHTWHLKGDYTRWEIMRKFGGVYVDADIICLCPLDELLAKLNKPAFVVQDGHFTNMQAVGILGFPPGHPLPEAMIQAQGKIQPKSKTIHGGMLLCHGLLSKVLPPYAATVQVLPAPLFYRKPFEVVPGNAFTVNCDLGRHEQDPSLVAIREEWLR